MPAYRAQSQSLSTVGGPQPPSQGVDIAGAIDALTGGATSLIHATMLRKQNERAAQQQADALAYQKSRDQQESARRDRQEEFERQKADREYMLQGGVPAHDEETSTPGVAQMRAPKLAPIRRAMVPPTKNGLPGYEQADIQPPEQPATMPMPMVTNGVEHVPDHTDVRKSRAYIQATETAKIRAEEQGRTQAAIDARQQRQIAAGKDSAVLAQQGRIALEQIRQAGKGSRISGAMTKNQMNSTAEKIADGLMVKFEGDRESAFKWLNSDDPDAKALRESKDMENKPLTWGTYLDNAQGRWVQGGTRQALTFQQGPMGDKPEKAAKRVQDTRRIVSQGSGPAPAAAKVPESLDFNAAANPLNGLTRIGKGPAPKVAAPAPAAAADTVTDDQFTQDDIDAAVAALPDTATEDDVRKYLIAQKKKKPSTAKR